MNSWEKDRRLDELAGAGWNVARFVSFAPSGSPRYERLDARTYVKEVRSVEGIEALFRHGAMRVNVRCFRPDSTQSNPFDYGLESPAVAIAQARARLAQGYHLIVNETIDTNDGGVSGVAEAGVWEFSPDATPRVVEMGPTCALPETQARRILTRVYGGVPDSPNPGRRLEWSIHPGPVGFRQQEWIVWEEGHSTATSLHVRPEWPNPFSRLVGDKTFGLLVAEALGLPVPRTRVIARRVPPFTFGEPTGSLSRWTRTAPVEARPGKFTTVRGWTDPFALLAKEDPSGREIAAVLHQHAVQAEFSGAVLPDSDGGWLIEGVAGSGDNFMLGEAAPEKLPLRVTGAVHEAMSAASALIGVVRAEWVFDGEKAWIVQFHRAHDRVSRGILNPGQPRNGWIDVVAGDGLEVVRNAVSRARAGGLGVRVIGTVGVTSHIGDVVRRAGVPGVVLES